MDRHACIAARHVALHLSLLLLLAALAGAGSPPDEPPVDLEDATDVERVESLNQAALASVASDPDKALELAQRAAEMARRSGDRAGQGTAEFAIGEAHYVRDDHTGALPHFVEARRLLQGTGSSARLAKAMRRIGDVHSRTGTFDEALAVYLDTLRLLEDHQAREPSQERLWDIGNLLGAIGNLFRSLEEPEKALAYYQRSLEVYEQVDYNLGVAGTSYNLGNLLFEAGDHDAALEHYLRARETASLLDDPTLLSMATTSIGSVFLERGQLDLALQRFAESLELCRTAGRTRGVQFALKRMGNVRHRQQRYSEAVDHYLEALAIAQESSAPSSQAELHKLLSECFADTDDHALALEHFEKHASIRSDLFNEARSRQVHELEIAYESERKDQEIEILKRDRAIQQWMRAALVLATVLAVAVGALGWSRNRLGVRAAREIRQANDELTRALSRVEQLSRTDYLTGLPNRRGVVERFDAELAGSTGAVVLADIDDFKRVNDRFGHECGDQVLVSVAERLRSMVRTQDLLGRWGGEEFILILPATDQDGAAQLTERIRRAIEVQVFLYKGSQVQVTLTFGVSSVDGSTSFEESLRHADRALYSGKQSGKNRIVLAG